MDIHKNITFNFLGVSVINQSIKFFTIFLLAFNVSLPVVMTVMKNTMKI